MYTYVQPFTTTRSRRGRIESTSVLWCCTINKNCQSNSDSYELMSFGFWLAVGGTLPYQIIIRSPNWNWVIIVNIIIYDRVDDSPRKNANVFSWNWVKLCVTVQLCLWICGLSAWMCPSTTWARRRKEPSGRRKRSHTGKSSSCMVNGLSWAHTSLLSYLKNTR